MNNLQKMITKLINCKHPKTILIEGPVGCGKTDMINQVCEQEGFKVLTVILSLFDPVDFKGIPVTIDGKTVWLTPDMWPSMLDDKTVIFFDEIDRAPKATVAPTLTLMQSRTLGTYTLPASTRMIAACNGQFDSGTQPLTHASNNRMAHFTYLPNLDDWKAWALVNDIDERLISYLDHKPEALYTSDIERGTKAFPSPRSLHNVSDILPLCDSNDMRDMVSAFIGLGHGTDFTAYCNIQMPDLQDIIDNPTTSPIPDKLDEKYFYTSVLTKLVKTDMSHFSAVMAYAKRLGSEFEFVTMTNIVKNDPLLKQTGTYTTWVITNKEII